tara:strand:+ start:124 stop:285 length:162 start_codon:yes stop_codon:yes gene_type:complete
MFIKEVLKKLTLETKSKVSKHTSTTSKAKSKNKKISGYYFDGKKLTTMYEKKR